MTTGKLMHRTFIYVAFFIVARNCFAPSTRNVAYAVLQPYQQGESALYLQSWEIHQFNAHQAMIDDIQYTQRQAVQSLCAELLPTITSSNTTNSTPIEHIVALRSDASSILSYQDLQDQCNAGTDTNPVICVIPAGITVRINADDDGAVVTRTINSTTTVHVILSVYALVVRGGTFQWYSTASGATGSDASLEDQQNSVLCTGYIAVEQGGIFSITNGYDPNDSNSSDDSFATSRQGSNGPATKIWIYIRDNGARHPILGSRVLGAVGTYSGNYSSSEELDSTSSSQPKIIIRDRSTTLVRSWSLLAASITTNDTVIQTVHDPVQMGWKIGDRIAIAPFADRAQGRAQTFIISNFIYNNDESAHSGKLAQIQLNKPSLYEFRGRALLSPGSNDIIFDSSEVINLSRNTIVSGDDFTEVPCDPTIVNEAYPGLTTSTEGCRCTESRSSCTVGLHTVHMYGGSTQIDNVRIEYCGQRGIEGKYCTHFHHLNDCPDCQLINNAIEYSQQRGIVVHSTHRSNVESNVLYNIRGAAIYLEDGNEIYNRLAYNVAICPYVFIEGGCTVPGTSNDQGDTSLNQAGLYMENPTNDLIGNRMVNHFNGMFLNPTNGHGPMEAQICTNHMPFGHWEGNTFHSSGRFGTYALNDNYPLQSESNGIESFLLPSSTLGIVTDSTSTYVDCSYLTIDGNDNGRSTTFWNNVDYGNAFVGHYSAGDIQYYGHSSMNNLNNIYWKETKSFQDGCSAHISHSYFVNGTMALPDTIGSFIIEHTTLQQILLSVNHHCGIGVTGFLCMPHYILENVAWIDDNANSIEQRKWVSFTDSNDAGLGGIISIAPNLDVASNVESNTTSFLPDGYVSLVSGFYPFLLSTGYCNMSSDLGYDVRYDSGILCTKLLQTFRIYSNGTDEYPLLIQVYSQSYDSAPIATQEIYVHYKGGKKRGYKFPVLPDEGLLYRISLVGGAGNVPANWFVDFGDIVMTNRYGVETIKIEIKGRACSNGVIQSNHDRRQLSTSYDNSIDNLLWGHGACTDYPNAIATDCESNSTSSSGQISKRGCPELCGTTDCEANGAYCHCLLAQCHCLPGRYGPMCEYDLCSTCGDSGGCASKFLGSTLSVSYEACMCEDGSSGEYCEGGQDLAPFDKDGTTSGTAGNPATSSPTPVNISGAQPPNNASSAPKPIRFETSASYTFTYRSLRTFALVTFLNVVGCRRIF